MAAPLSIQFSHANGIPAGTYDPLFDQLAPHTIHAVPAYGTADISLESNWRDLVPELIKHIESHGNYPVIGLGHSLGGVLTFWAAQERPDLFRAVIVMDPPLLSRQARLAIRMANALGLKNQLNGLVKQALNRKSEFKDLAEARAYWGAKRFFANFHPDSFEAYLKYALKPHGENSGLTLSIPKELEANVFALMPHRHRFQLPGIPFFYLYPPDDQVDLWMIPQNRKHFPDATFIEMPGGHMFPLERPTETAKQLKEILDDLAVI